MIRLLIALGSKRRTAALVWFAIDVTIGLVLLTQPAITEGLLSGLKGILRRVFLTAIAAAQSS